VAGLALPLGASRACIRRDEDRHLLKDMLDAPGTARAIFMGVRGAGAPGMWMRTIRD